ncbi:rubredoxin [Pedobacter alpinus]|uniref:Rubredoxin n=1 Tax=Pedobacter alpinus TaxID=1590643 RepID=A0ABW5TNL7_9SPHI
MEKTEHIIKINLPGGIVSPGDLHEILCIAEKCKVKNVRFGNRQQLLFVVNDEYLDDLNDLFLVGDVAYEIDTDDYPNLVSSYVTEEIFPTSLWLTEGVYKDVLDGFNHQPKLKINIVDYYQNLIPFFTGNLNFIASETNNFWYLYIRFPKTNQMYCWPTLVYSEDIAEMSRVLEQFIDLNSEKKSFETQIIGEEIYHKVKNKFQFLSHTFEKPLVHTDFQLPYYEGLNRYSDNKSWLGIYRRNEEYSLDFLKEICEICLETRIGQLYTTSWKSIVIKNINNKDRVFWSDLLNKYRVNIRHAANELNWQTEDFSKEALRIKLDLVKAFEEADLRTYRLCFAIKTQPKTGLFSSIVVRKRNSKNANGEELYELLYTKDFNPNSKEYITYHEGVVYSELAPKLMEICEVYYTLRLNKKELQQKETQIKKTVETDKIFIAHQCKHCFTIYDERYGDLVNNIPVGVKFDSLENFSCPTCDAPKTDFEQIKLNKMLIG